MYESSTLWTKWFASHQANAAGAFIVHQGNVVEHFGSHIKQNGVLEKSPTAPRAQSVYFNTPSRPDCGTKYSMSNKIDMCLWFLYALFVWIYVHNRSLWVRENRTNSQIPQCTCPISHNASFRTEMCTIMFWMVHWGLRDWWIVRFVRLVWLFSRWPLAQCIGIKPQ